MLEKLPAGFRKYIDVDDATGCWRWIGAKTSGYGRWRDPEDGTLWRAHRFTYTVLVASVDPTLQLDHLCENRGCVNPKHLEPVAPRVNNNRAAISRGRRGTAGSIEALGPNRWRLVVSLGKDPITGKYRRISKVFHGTKRDAQNELAAFVVAKSKQRISGSETTLRALLDAYLDQRTKMSPGTRGDYDGYIRRSIPAALADTPINKIGVYELDQLYRHLEARGGVCRRRGDNKCTTKTCAHGAGGSLAPATVGRVHTIIHAAFELAVRWQWLAVNPAAAADPGEAIAEEVDLPPSEDLVRLLVHLDTLERDEPGDYTTRPGTPLADFVAVLLGTGARPGELCALRYSALDGNVLTVRENVSRAPGGAIVKETKTGKKRRLAVPASVRAIFDERRAMWREAALAAGIPLDDMAVFPSRARPDRPWRPDSIGREFRDARDTLDLDKRMTLRNLRHYVQSVLLAGGVDVVTVAKRGGHSPKVLLEVYAHMLETPDLAAAEFLEGHIAEVRGRRPRA